jgi:hypothetical protein
MSDLRDRFDCTPQQYHGGLDKLWNALQLFTVQDKDVFTLCAERLEQLRAENERLKQRIAELDDTLEKLEVSYIRARCGYGSWKHTASQRAERIAALEAAAAELCCVLGDSGWGRLRVEVQNAVWKLSALLTENIAPSEGSGGMDERFSRPIHRPIRAIDRCGRTCRRNAGT